MNSTSLDEARAAKGQAMAAFEKLATVVGVGITRIDGGYGIKVNLRERPLPEVYLPAVVNGVPVKVEVVGTIRERQVAPPV